MNKEHQKSDRKDQVDPVGLEQTSLPQLAARADEPSAALASDGPTRTSEERKTPIDHFRESMALFDDDKVAARLDAELENRRNNPDRPVPQSQWRQEVRDPFGWDWAWADLRDDETQG